MASRDVLIPYESDGEEEEEELPMVRSLPKQRLCRGFDRSCSAKAKHNDGLCGHCHAKKQRELQKWIEQHKKKREEELREAIEIERLRLEMQQHEQRLQARFAATKARLSQQQPALLLGPAPPPRPITTLSEQQVQLLVGEMRKHWPQGVNFEQLRAAPEVAQLSDQLLHALIHVAYNAQNVALLQQRAGAGTP